MPELDVRELPPEGRHVEIRGPFESMASGETPVPVDDHDPRPLHYEMQATVDAFGADGDEVAEEAPDRFVAVLSGR